MWIFTQNSFLSIVKHNQKGNLLVVRSRFKGHIQRIFPKARVLEDANRDYRFRVELPIREVSKVIARLVSEIDYDNFKNSLNIYDGKYLDCCLDVYNAVARNSIERDLDNFIYGRRKPDESKQTKG
jgi:putative AlgH/UPF0301 family transcriptional regulator